MEMVSTRPQLAGAGAKNSCQAYPRRFGLGIGSFHHKAFEAVCHGLIALLNRDPDADIGHGAWRLARGGDAMMPVSWLPIPGQARSPMRSIG